MKKLICAILSIVLIANMTLATPEVYGLLSDSFRRIKQPGWGIQLDTVNEYLKGLGFAFEVPTGSVVRDGTEFVLTNGYLLKFQQKGDDRFATVFDRNNNPVAAMKVLRDSSVVVTMYAGDFTRAVNFIGGKVGGTGDFDVKVEETGSDGKTWALTWKAKPEGRDEALLLLRAPSGEVFEKIKSSYETWLDFGNQTIETIPSVFVEKNAVMRIRQVRKDGDVRDADIVDLDSISLHQAPNGGLYTLLTFWDEQNNIPYSVLYQGRVVFDTVQKASEPEKVLDTVINMAKRGTVPREATLVSEWKDHTYRGKAVHRGAVVAAITSAAATLVGTLGFDPTNLFISGIVGSVVGYILYKAQKPVMLYGIKEIMSMFMNIERINNLYPASQEFLTNGIERAGGYWVRFNVLNGSGEKTSELAMNAYRTLADEPTLPQVANGKLHMSVGSDAFSFEVRMKEIYSWWLLSQMFPYATFSLSNRNQKDQRNLGWKWAGGDFWAGLVTEGRTTPLQYTDVGLFGSYAVPADSPIWSGEPLIGKSFAGQANTLENAQGVFDSRKNENDALRAQLQSELAQVDADLAAWSGFPAIFTKFFNSEFRELQVKKRVLEEKIKIVSTWTGNLNTFINELTGKVDPRKINREDTEENKKVVWAFDWVEKISDPTIKQKFVDKLKALGVIRDENDMHNMTLLELFRRQGSSILTQAQAGRFGQTGILVFQNGQILDPSVLPGWVEGR